MTAKKNDMIFKKTLEKHKSLIFIIFYSCLKNEHFIKNQQPSIPKVYFDILSTKLSTGIVSKFKKLCKIKKLYSM